MCALAGQTCHLAKGERENEPPPFLGFWGNYRLAEVKERMREAEKSVREQRAKLHLRASLIVPSAALTFTSAVLLLAWFFSSYSPGPPLSNPTQVLTHTHTEDSCPEVHSCGFLSGCDFAVGGCPEGMALNLSGLTSHNSVFLFSRVWRALWLDTPIS